MVQAISPHAQTHGNARMSWLLGKWIITLIWYDCTTSSFPLIRTPVAPVAKIERLADRNVSAKACDCCSNLWSQRGQRQEHMTHARPHGARHHSVYTVFGPRRQSTKSIKIIYPWLSLHRLYSFVVSSLWTYQNRYSRCYRMHGMHSGMPHIV